MAATDDPPGRTPAKDWHAWHEPYDLPGSPLAVRLAIVQSYIRVALDTAPSGPVRIVSLCAGQGRDLLPVLQTHPRRDDARARLVELDARNTEAARATADQLGLSAQVEVVEGDAALTDHYIELAPAELVVCCGVFGNVSDTDVQRIISFFPRLCARQGVVVWTRHRRPPDLTVSVRRWIEEAGFEEMGFEGPTHLRYVGAGAARFTSEPQPLVAGERLFDWLEDPLPPA